MLIILYLDSLCNEKWTEGSSYIRNEYRKVVSKFSLTGKRYVKKPYAVIDTLLAYTDTNLSYTEKRKSAANDLHILSNEDDVEQFDKK